MPKTGTGSCRARMIRIGTEALSPRRSPPVSRPCVQGTSLGFRAEGLGLRVQGFRVVGVGLIQP